MAFKEMINTWANDPYVTCEDTSKCGQCLKEQIRSEVAKEFLANHTGTVESVDLHEIEGETKVRFQQTPLYKRVQSLMAEGHDLKKIAKDLMAEGIEI